MKLKLTFILLLFLAMSFKTASAYTLNSFHIESPYLSGSNVQINSDPTNIVFDFEVSRSMNTYDTNGAAISITAVLVFRDATGAETNISTPVIVSSASFGAAYNIFYAQRVAAAIPATDVGGTILLKVTGYEYSDFFQESFPVGGYSSTTYGQVLGGTPIPPPVLYPTLDVFPAHYSTTTFNLIYTNPLTTGGAITKITSSDSQPVLTPGQSIYSPNGNNRLTLQTDGNLVLYRKNSNGSETGIWSSRTAGMASASLYFQTDGNLVIYNSSHTGLWASNIYSYSGSGVVTNAYYALQDDGGFVLYWPTYYFPAGKYLAWVIAASSDTGGEIITAHGGNLNHPIDPFPTAVSDVGTAFHNTR
ncbi:MAG TPA: hypothetical protein VL490_09710 [Mucilaginibacter sp.]|jgi:hypothetical protein|nr:hypothetical protein [Mucilaginibacter sp.]